ncbi:MAG: hypothetical protein AB1486_09170 [Planctomycetota bacterium]
MKKLATTLFAATALCGMLAFSARADGRHPGSLLVYPIYDSQPGVATILTVTNTNSDQSYNPATKLAAGTVDVEYKYIDAFGCREFNRTERLTPNDTLSVLAGHHNAQSALGYLYLFAKHPKTGEAISWNYLIGSMVSLDGIEVVEYSTNAWAFRALPGTGEATDLDGDGIRDLDGGEYEMTADELLFPRFFGQSEVLFTSHLVLINLTGGPRFTATADLLIYNDNEQVFSAEVEFNCWAVRLLRSISGAFTNAFLKLTNHDPDEIRGLDFLESGWFRLDGGMASSSMVSIDDPAILGCLLEFVGPFGAADLPFEKGTQDNGDLLPRSVFGDN